MFGFSRKKQEVVEAETGKKEAGVIKSDGIGSVKDHGDYHVSPDNNAGCFDAAIKTMIGGKVVEGKPLAPMITGSAIAMDGVSVAMDGTGMMQSPITTMGGSLQLDWYAAQAFIGPQACAIIMQNGYINKACRIVGEDAMRPGYNVTTNNGKKLDPEIISGIKEVDRRMGIASELKQFDMFSRVYGIRVAIFEVQSDDPEYYQKPFNIDGVKPGSYTGISQVDPMWIMPILDRQAAANPASSRFDDPTWWMINGVYYHHTHLAIIRYAPLPSILKPAYNYGGLPLTQLLMSRLYSAEASADEAPKILTTLRTYWLKTNLKKAISNFPLFEQTWNRFASFKNNQSVQMIGEDDELGLLTTSLTDIDDVIMNQFQLFCALSEVPMSKMMAEAPSGLSNENGQDDKNYAQVCANAQIKMSVMLDRHHQLVMKSIIEPKAGDQPHIHHVWNPVDTPTEKEKAEVKKMNAETHKIYWEMGVKNEVDIADELTANDPFGSVAPSDSVTKELDIEEMMLEMEEFESDPELSGITATPVVTPNGV